jgi:hypothetical protein
MADGIDAGLNRLKASPVDRDLSRLESEVWRRIDGAKSSDLFGGRTLQVQLAVSCAALLLGLAIAQLVGEGPMARVLSSEMVVLSDDSAMAPSVRLEGGI